MRCVWSPPFCWQAKTTQQPTLRHSNLLYFRLQLRLAARTPYRPQGSSSRSSELGLVNPYVFCWLFQAGLLPHFPRGSVLVLLAARRLRL